MFNESCSLVSFKNTECPFTELFSILVRYELLSTGLPAMVYNSREIEVMHQHIDNAVKILLRGLQDLGQLVGVVTQTQHGVIDNLSSIGFFISLICNLSEALNTLRLDTDELLRLREKSLEI